MLSKLIFKLISEMRQPPKVVMRKKSVITQYSILKSINVIKLEITPAVKFEHFVFLYFLKYILKEKKLPHLTKRKILTRSPSLRKGTLSEPLSDESFLCMTCHKAVNCIQ